MILEKCRWRQICQSENLNVSGAKGIQAEFRRGRGVRRSVNSFHGQCGVTASKTEMTWCDLHFLKITLLRQSGKGLKGGLNCQSKEANLKAISRQEVMRAQK